MSDPETAHGPSGYYFAENGEYLASKLAAAISAALHCSSGGTFSQQLRTYTEEELLKNPKAILRFLLMSSYSA
jgi:hypothetical protein